MTEQAAADPYPDFDLRARTLVWGDGIERTDLSLLGGVNVTRPDTADLLATRMACGSVEVAGRGDQFFGVDILRVTIVRPGEFEWTLFADAPLQDALLDEVERSFGPDVRDCVGRLLPDRAEAPQERGSGLLESARFVRVLVELGEDPVAEGEASDGLPFVTELVRGGWRLEFVVDLASGEVVGWPDGGSGGFLSVKVADLGVYELLDENGSLVASHRGYVPHGVVPGEFGDYIRFEIAGDGVVIGWPMEVDLSEFGASD